MKNVYIWITLIIVSALSLIPPIDFVIRNPQNPYWLWFVMMSACAGVFTVFIETNIAVKLIAIIGLVNCFFSAVPYVSFTSYISLVLCCYLYIMASRIDNWGWIFKSLQAVVILDILIFFMQSIHHDPLLNFGLKQVDHFGTLGQHMQMGSFGIVITSLLINFSVANFFAALLYAIFCKSSWSFICVGVGFVIIFLKKDTKLALCILGIALLIFLAWSNHQGKLQNFSGRLPVWEKSFELASKHPWTGWGIGTYKDLFHPLSRFNCIPWKEAHDFIAQLCFEVGYPATAALLFGLGCLFRELLKDNAWLLVSGLSMILVDALVHFPDRMLQTVPMIVIFLAYCAHSLRKDSLCPSCSQS